MNHTNNPLACDLVLIGGGHAHVHIIKMLGMPKYVAMRDTHGIQVGG